MSLITPRTEENIAYLGTRHGVDVYVMCIEFDRDLHHHDEPCLVFRRHTFGHGRRFVFPLCDAWTVREPEHLADTAEAASELLWVAPSKRDTHNFIDMLLEFIEHLIKWRPDDDATLDKLIFEQEIQKTGLFVQLNGETIVDGR